MDTGSINYVAILVAGIAAMVVGAVWYSPMLFAKAWMKALGRDMDKMSKEDMMEMRKKGGPGYLVAFLTLLVIGYVMSIFMITAANASGMHGATFGASIGFWAWLGFVATTFLSMAMFEGRPKALYLINVGQYLAAFLVMGAILGAWMK